MTITLTRRGRALLLFLSAAGYTAWFSGLGERSDAAGAETTLPVAASTPHLTSEPNLATVIARDPFAGNPIQHTATLGNESSASVTGSSTDDASPERIAGSAGGIVVPNIGNAPNVGSLAPTPLPLVVRATIVGRNPVAYVENGTMMDIVRIGDTLGDQRVTSIDLSGLSFADGSRLDLQATAGATPASGHQAVSVAQRLDEIRRLLSHLKSAAPASVPQNAVTAPAPTSSTATYPSPAPLATVDARGIPVGVNPTSDPSAPTPYPDPYPYAPARR